MIDAQLARQEEQLKQLRFEKTQLQKILNRVKDFLETQHVILGINGGEQPCACTDCVLKRRTLEILLKS